jgi:hypothetical protein
MTWRAVSISSCLLHRCAADAVLAVFRLVQWHAAGEEQRMGERVRVRRGHCEGRQCEKWFMGGQVDVRGRYCEGRYGEGRTVG